METSFGLGILITILCIYVAAWIHSAYKMNNALNDGGFNLMGIISLSLLTGLLNLNLSIAKAIYSIFSSPAPEPFPRWGTAPPAQPDKIEQ
jgi:hypothetical protein